MRTLIQLPAPTDSEWEPSGTFDAVDLDALGDCLGYRVDDPNGRVGTVAGIGLRRLDRSTRRHRDTRRAVPASHPHGPG